MSDRNQSGANTNSNARTNAANEYRGSRDGKDRSQINAVPDSDGAAQQPAQHWPDQMLKAKSFTPAYAEPVKQPPRRSWLKIAATVALVFGLGWLPANYFLKNGWSIGNTTTANAASRAQVARLITEEKSTLARVMSDLRILQSAYANVQSQITALPSGQDQKALAASLASVRKALKTIRKRAIAAQKDQFTVIAGLNQKLIAAEKSRRQEARAFQDRLMKLEAAFQQSQQVAAAQILKLAKLEKKKSNVSSVGRATARKPARNSTSYVLREVYRGVALVEGRRGLVEAVPGTYLPGAGRVRSIKRRSGKWIVVTSRGVIDSQSY